MCESVIYVKVKDIDEYMIEENSIAEGDIWLGMVYPPFQAVPPSAYTAEKAFGTPITSAGPRRTPIGSPSDGWVERPDAGRSAVSDVPIGESWILLVLAIMFGFMLHRKRIRSLGLALLCFLNAGLVCATEPSITDLVFSTQSVAAEDSITVTPTISAAEGSLYVCWEVFEDAACTHKISTPFVYKGSNAVRFAAPKDSGTYYVRTSLHHGSTCHRAPFTSRTKVFHVYPGDADIVLARDHQGSGAKLNLRAVMPENKKVYGVLRFAKTTLNDDLLSMYQRYNYFVSFPFDVRAGDICGFGTIGTDWRICYYDGLGRAQNGFFANHTDNWAMIADTDDILHANEGYLLQLNYLSMDASNDAIWGNRDVVELYFPAQSTITDVVAGNETIPALSEDYQCTINKSASLGEEGDRRVKDSYWRCIGTPSFTEGANTDLEYLYQWNRTNNSLNVVSGSGFAFLPTHAYLVQAQDAICWTNVSKPAAIVARQQTLPVSFYEFLLCISMDEEQLDRTYVRLTEDERVSAEFDFGHDLAKELNDGTNIYSQVGYERLAGNCLPAINAVTVVPIGVRIAEQGSYTFSMPEGTSGIGVTFVDAVNGNRTNMALDTYTAYLEEGTHDERFWLEIAPVPQTATTLIHPDADQYRNSRKVIIDGQLLIEYNGQLFNARGIRIKE